MLIFLNKNLNALTLQLWSGITLIKIKFSEESNIATLDFCKSDRSHNFIHKTILFLFVKSHVPGHLTSALWIMKRGNQSSAMLPDGTGARKVPRGGEVGGETAG